MKGERIMVTWKWKSVKQGGRDKKIKQGEIGMNGGVLEIGQKLLEVDDSRRKR